MSNERFKALERITKSAHAALGEIRRQLVNEAAAVQGLMNMTAFVTEKANDYAEELLDLEVLRYSIFQLLNGFLTPEILPIAQVQQMLHVVKEHLITASLKLRPVFTHPSHVYRYRSFFFWRSNNTVFITIKIPLTPFDEAFWLMRSYVFPLIVPGHNMTTVLTKVPQFCTWNERDLYYFTFDQKPTVDNAGILHMDAYVEVPQHKNNPSCMTALMTDDLPAVSKLCGPKLSADTHRPLLMSIGLSKVLVSGITQYTLQCNNGTSIVSHGRNMTSVVFVPCGCLLKSKYGDFVAQNVHCNGSDGNLVSDNSHDEVNVVNLHILASFLAPKNFPNIVQVNYCVNLLTWSCQIFPNT